MAGFLKGLLGGAFGLAYFALSAGILVFYITAFAAGADEWFGWYGWWVPALAIVAAMFLGPVGLLAISIVGGYGAIYAWDWPVWVALLVFFPMIPIMIGSLIMAALGAVVERVRG